jgi:hypothetical protein
MGDGNDAPRTGTTVSATPGGDGATKLSDSGLDIIIAMGSAGGNLATIVGKKVTLQAQDADKNLVSGAWYLENTTAGDDAIKGYDYNAAKPTDVVKLLDQNGDLTNKSRIEVFWVKPGKKRVVFTSERGVTAGKYITVTAPAFTGDAVTTPVAQRVTTKDATGAIVRAPRLELGDHFKVLSSEWPGIRFRYAVTPGPGGDGEITGVQLMLNKNVFVTSDGVTHNPIGQEYVLDTVAPYEAPSAVFENKKGAWIRPADERTGSVEYNNGDGTFTDPFDTPCVPLDDRHFKAVRVQQFFKMFLMYRPKGPTPDDSVWVTLGVIEWYWTISTTIENGMWLEPTDVAWPQNNPVPSKPSSELPRWSRVFLRDTHYKLDYDPPVVGDATL